MLLQEMLVYADIEQLHQLAESYQCECNVNSKNELIQSLLSSIKRDSTIKQQLKQLTEAELHFLLLLLFDKRSSLTIEDLRAKAKLAYLEEVEKNTYRQLIVQALNKGWIFKINGSKNGALFKMPEDLRKKWINVLIKAGEYQWTDPYRPAVYRDEGMAMAEDLKIFLAFVRETPVQLTENQIIYRRIQEKLFSLFTVKEEMVPKEGWRFGYGRCFKDYPDRFSLIYDYCYFRRWIFEENGYLLSVSDPLSSVKAAELLHLIYTFWLRLYKRPIPNLPMLSGYILTLCMRGWTPETEILHRVKRFVRPYYYDDPENIIRTRILKMLVHLGALRTAKHQLLNDNTYETTSIGYEYVDNISGFSQNPLKFETIEKGF